MKTMDKNYVTTEGRMEILKCNYRGFAIKEYVTIFASDGELIVDRLYRASGNPDFRRPIRGISVEDIKDQIDTVLYE
jgi:hypothetical protein